MGRAPCCDKENVKRGPWSPEEDAKLRDFIYKYGSAGNWIALPHKAGLKRCGKSCRLRWLNYLRPNIKHGDFSHEEDTIISALYATIGSRWSIIASQLPGRTDNDIKNYWNTKLKKKIMGFNLIPKNQPKFLPPSSFPLETLTPQSQSLSHLYNSIYDQHSNFNGYFPMRDNMLVFGDGGVKQEKVGFIEDFMENRNLFVIDESLGNAVAGNGELQSNLEEVKQHLINSGGGDFWFGDGSKPGEVAMYYNFDSSNKF